MLLDESRDGDGATTTESVLLCVLIGPELVHEDSHDFVGDSMRDRVIDVVSEIVFDLAKTESLLEVVKDLVRSATVPDIVRVLDPVGVHDDDGAGCDTEVVAVCDPADRVWVGEAADDPLCVIVGDLASRVSLDRVVDGDVVTLRDHVTEADPRFDRDLRLREGELEPD